jgi:hypothetical protein
MTSRSCFECLKDVEVQPIHGRLLILPHSAVSGGECPGSGRWVGSPVRPKKSESLKAPQKQKAPRGAQGKSTTGQPAIQRASSRPALPEKRRAAPQAEGKPSWWRAELARRSTGQWTPPEERVIRKSGSGRSKVSVSTVKVERKSRGKGGSVWTVSGGLPGLGKRR